MKDELQKKNRFCHNITARVYYADTDFSGVVYHARYLEFFERARTEFLRYFGISHKELLKDQNSQTEESVFFAVHHMSIDFKSSAHIDDFLRIETNVVETKGARCLMEQKIFQEETEKLLVTAFVEIILMNQKNRPKRFPRKWADSFLIG